MKRLALSSTLLLSLGCEPDLGVCDESAAHALVYDDGVPAFEGQALVIDGCIRCHGEGVEADDRNGAPRGLEFDVRLASQTPDVNEAELSRLRRASENLYFLRHLVYGQVQSGAMPPPETANGPPTESLYQRVPEGEREGPPLPSVESDEGRAILRNWLACDAPVVERTLMRNDGNENSVGETHSTIETTPVEPRWSEIYPRIIERSCAFSDCHDAATAAGALDMSTSAVALAALRSGARGRLCGDSGAQRVVPGEPIDDENPAQSLLILKLRGSGPAGRVCGSRMPMAGNYLSEARVEAIETWIRNGANDD
ncbi:MAG: hypothetical protein H6719_27465 [Sandaracinaceae bacterium]|nr:hypothetical protein [Sandaracinaceae bacterium]